MAKLYNLARMTTATTGTGTITLGAAAAGYLTFALAGVVDGDVVAYGIKDGNNSEVGTGTYTASGTTLTRSVTKSTNSNSPINLSGTAEIFIVARVEDFVNKAGDTISGSVTVSGGWYQNAGTAPSPGTTSASGLWSKDRDATNNRAWWFNDVGGIVGDANGGAFWRGFFLQGPTYTDPVGGGFLFPIFCSYWEFNSATAPTTRNFVWDCGNVSTTSLPTFRVKINNVEQIAYDPAGYTMMPASRYLNWGTTGGSSGYGIRDNSGVIEIKNSGGEWAAPGWRLLNTLTASNSANLSDTTSFTSAYSQYMVVFENLIPATTNTQLQMQVNSGGVQSTNYVDNGLVWSSGGSGGIGQSTSALVLTDAACANSSPGVSGEMRVNQPSQTASPKQWWGRFSYKATSAQVSQGAMANGYWNGGNGALTGFQVQFSSGNISTGMIRIYGLK
jgi:hypothetical protein